MTVSQIFVWAFTLSLCMVLGSPLEARSSLNRTYAFTVFLEDEKIGRQRFTVSSDGTRTTVEIQARFEVKYWLLKVYDYRHTNTEVWKGECLSMIRSETNDNGKNFFVNGISADNQLTLVTHAGSRRVEGCVKTFAYWNRDFLSNSSLLNSQTGEINRITSSNLGEEVILVRKHPTPAIHYRVVAEKFSIDLWYSSSGEWLALQSTTEDDSTLRYELQ